MTEAIAEHWGKGDVYGLIVSALGEMSKPLEGLTVEDLAPVDHFHARGLPATVELADRLPIAAGQHILDIGCGLGGPARYLAKRFHPVPWSADGTGAYLVTPEETRAILEKTGFVDIVIEDTGAKYVAGYRMVIERAEKGALPPLGTHLLLGETALPKTRNAARNIEEGRTRPIQLLCRKPR